MGREGSLTTAGHPPPELSLRIAGVMHMEGAEAIGPDIDALYRFHQMGLRSPRSGLARS